MKSQEDMLESNRRPFVCMFLRSLSFFELNSHVTSTFLRATTRNARPPTGLSTLLYLFLSFHSLYSFLGKYTALSLLLSFVTAQPSPVRALQGPSSPVHVYFKPTTLTHLIDESQHVQHSQCRVHAHSVVLVSRQLRKLLRPVEGLAHHRQK